MAGSAKGSTPWTHASRSSAASKAWQTKRATGKIHGGGTTPYIPRAGHQPRQRATTGQQFQIGATYNFGPKGRFRKTSKGWERVPD